MSQSQLGRAQFEPYFPHLQKFLEWPRLVYLQPFSTRSEPFTEFNNQPYKFITDDFCHEKAFTGKVTAKTTKSVIKLKETVTTKDSVTELNDEVKLWFDLPNHGALYTKIKSSNYIKVQYDHGLRLYNNKYYYLFGGINSNKLLDNVDVRIGLGILTDNGQCQNRIKANLKKDDMQYYWYHKSFIAHRDLRFGFLSAVNLNQMVFQKTNLLLGYYFQKKTCAFLRAEVNGFRSHNPDIKHVDTIFDTITADLIHRINDNSRAALQAVFNIRDRALSQAKAVYEYEHSSRRVIKGSLSSKLNLALVAKTPLYGLEDIGTLSVGLGINGISTNKPQFKSGLEVNLNL